MRSIKGLESHHLLEKSVFIVLIDSHCISIDGWLGFWLDIWLRFDFAFIVFGYGFDLVTVTIFAPLSVVI